MSPTFEASESGGILACATGGEKCSIIVLVRKCGYRKVVLRPAFLQDDARRQAHMPSAFSCNPTSNGKALFGRLCHHSTHAVGNRGWRATRRTGIVRRLRVVLHAELARHGDVLSVQHGG